MPTRLPTRRLTVLAAAFLALAAVGTLTACSSTTGGQPNAVVSEADLSGEPVTAAEDMTALCEQVVTEALPLEAAVALAEASGYATRVSSIDGQVQPTTKDMREDRFTFEVEGGLVTACTTG